MILFIFFDNSRFLRINPSILCVDPDTPGGGGGVIYMAFSWRAYDGPTLKAGLVAL